MIACFLAPVRCSGPVCQQNRMNLDSCGFSMNGIAPNVGARHRSDLRPAAVDHQLGTCHVAALVRSEEERRRTQFLGGTETTERHHA